MSGRTLGELVAEAVDYEQTAEDWARTAREGIAAAREALRRDDPGALQHHGRCTSLMKQARVMRAGAARLRAMLAIDAFMHGVRLH